MQYLPIGLSLHVCTLQEPAPVIRGRAKPASLDAIEIEVQRGPEASSCTLAFVLTGWASGIRLKTVGVSHRLPQKASGIAVLGAFSYPCLTALVTRMVARSFEITSLLSIG